MLKRYITHCAYEGFWGNKKYLTSWKSGCWLKMDDTGPIKKRKPWEPSRKPGLKFLLTGFMLTIIESNLNLPQAVNKS